MGNRKAFAADLIIRCESSFPHVLGEKAPRKTRHFRVCILKNDERGRGRSRLNVGGLLFASGLSWKEAWDRALAGVELAAKINGVSMERILSMPSMTHAEFIAGLDGYGRGCRVGHQSAYHPKDVAMFAAAVREGRRHKMRVSRCTKGAAQDIYRRLCGMVGAGPKVSTQNSGHPEVRLSAADDAETVYAALAGKNSPPPRHREAT